MVHPDTGSDGVIDNNDTGYADADGDGMSDNTESTTEPSMVTTYQITRHR